MADDPETPEENEIVAAARAAKHHREAADGKDGGRLKNWELATIGVGIGSAAIAAALLYANRGRGKKD